MFFIHKWNRNINSTTITHSKGDKNKSSAEQIKENEQNLTEINKGKSDNSLGSNFTNLMKELAFYSEKDIILPEYHHLRTSKEIMKSLDAIRYPKKESRYSGGISFEISYSSFDTNFVKDSIKYAQKRGVKCPEIPLQAYWTTFDKLNPKQLKWYFYWREQALRGNYLNVDLSYIFLFVYELLNYSFNSKAAFNVSMLVRLYENYLERHPKLEHYLPQWIADMLYEIGEIELAKKWDQDNVYTPKLYTLLQEKEDELQKISITTWKPYIRNYRETAFFKKHKNKVYKIFKESVPLLKEFHAAKGEKLVDVWFEIRNERIVRQLYRSAVVGREYDPIHLHVVRYYPTDIFYNEINTLFRLAENVARALNGEKREIKVEDGILPDDFKDKMLERFSNAARKTYERFKVVQKREGTEEGSAIPLPSEKKEKIASKVIIEFDDEKIKILNQQSIELQEEFDKRSSEFEVQNEELPVSKESPLSLDDDRDEKENSTFENTESTSENLSQLGNIFGALVAGDEELDEFIEALSDVELEFLSQFENGKFSVDEAKHFVKQKGLMLGMFLSDLNEKSNEYLGDNVVEEQDEVIAIYEEYEQVISLAKESFVHEN